MRRKRVTPKAGWFRANRAPSSGKRFSRTRRHSGSAMASSRTPRRKATTEARRASAGPATRRQASCSSSSFARVFERPKACAPVAPSGSKPRERRLPFMRRIVSEKKCRTGTPSRAAREGGNLPGEGGGPRRHPGPARSARSVGDFVARRLPGLGSASGTANPWPSSFFGPGRTLFRRRRRFGHRRNDPIRGGRL